MSDESAVATDLSNCIFTPFQLMIHVYAIHSIALMTDTCTEALIMHNQIFKCLFFKTNLFGSIGNSF